MAKTTLKSFRSAYFYIQPIWRIYGRCEGGAGVFPPYVRVPIAVLQLMELSSEALAYYVYWLAGNQREQEWSSQQQQLLKLSEKQIKRLRTELRAHGLLTATRAGTQTYTVLHCSPVPAEDREKVGSKYAELIKRQWGQAQRYGLKTHVDAVTPFFHVHVGAPEGKTMVVFIDSIRKAAVELLPEHRGMNRLRALGLWLKMSNRPAWHNWRSPGAIAKEVGYSTNQVKAHLRDLIALGLVFYDEKAHIVGVSRFPTGVLDHLHPMKLDASHIPWKSFTKATEKG